MLGKRVQHWLHAVRRQSWLSPLSRQPGIPKHVTRAAELFSGVQWSHDEDDEVHLTQILQHVSYRIAFDMERATALLESATALGWTNIPPFVQGRMVLHSIKWCLDAARAASNMQHVTALFNKSAAEHG